MAGQVPQPGVKQRGDRVVRPALAAFAVSAMRLRVGPAYAGTSGFAAVASQEDIAGPSYSLAASRYVTTEPSSDPQAEQEVRRLHEELEQLHRRAGDVDALVDVRLSEVFA